MIIQILVDNPNSWILPYAIELKRILDSDHLVSLLHEPNEVQKGDILCLLSCEKVFKKLGLNKHNLVVHESDLPNGKGWSPLTWQVLEGRTLIPITLFEATKKVDEGDIYLQEFVDLDGTELIDELRDIQGRTSIKLITQFVNMHSHLIGRPQKGVTTYYERRTAESSKLDINQSIASQINLLRIVDNDRYPAFFEYMGTKYKLLITKFEE